MAASISGAMSPPFDLGPRPHLGYTQSKIDRVAERRLDKDWLAARFSDAGTHGYVTVSYTHLTLPTIYSV